MKKKFMCWWGGGYGEDLRTRDLTWFDVIRGYTLENIENIEILSIGESYTMSNGDHIITRVL